MSVVKPRLIVYIDEIQSVSQSINHMWQDFQSTPIFFWLWEENVKNKSNPSAEQPRKATNLSQFFQSWSTVPRFYLNCSTLLTLTKRRNFLFFIFCFDQLFYFLWTVEISCPGMSQISYLSLLLLLIVQANDELFNDITSKTSIRRHERNDVWGRKSKWFSFY